MTDEEDKLKQLEQEKERRIVEYMSLQDRADDLNEQIYQICCGIETLNGKIEIAREEARKAEERARLNGAPANGGRQHSPRA